MFKGFCTHSRLRGDAKNAVSHVNGAKRLAYESVAPTPADILGVDGNKRSSKRGITR